MPGVVFLSFLMEILGRDLFIGCVLIAVWNFSLVVMHGLLVAVASLVTEHRF